MTTENYPITHLSPARTKNYGMATAVSVVFKTLAWGWLIATIFAATNGRQDAIDLNANPDQQGAIVVAILVVGIGLACWSAFFGYVISLLRDVAQNTEDNLK